MRVWSLTSENPQSLFLRLVVPERQHLGVSGGIGSLNLRSPSLFESRSHEGGVTQMDTFEDLSFMS